MTDKSTVRREIAADTMIVAAILLVTSGVLHILQGIAAIGNDQVFVVITDYTYEFDLTVWGWVHLVLGIVIALVGAALFRGGLWARTLAVTLAAASIVVNFLWLPHYPAWAIAIIAIDTAMIWAVMTAIPRSARH
ncbi:hypothetical protein O4328_20375 [Rhodococcus opacus]|uniref:DUF7144 domain-containing protein n=2 Tax=Rhodococcus TaxID=1827 RepID=A0AAX3YRW8_RHOOP|nr:hypothetical protein [Rhodococcus opacus]MCZ4586023.1 hypothetical protein [Rhodococcus opacus]WLF52026.1 hypothetical protein Q5707_42020 [Rhodococcus opacus]